MKLAFAFIALFVTSSAVDFSALDLNSLEMDSLAPVLMDIMTQVSSADAGDDKTHKEIEGVQKLLDDLRMKLEKEGASEKQEFTYSTESMELLKDEVEIKNNHTRDTIAAAEEDRNARAENIKKQKELVKAVRNFLTTLRSEGKDTAKWESSDEYQKAKAAKAAKAAEEKKEENKEEKKEDEKKDEDKEEKKAEETVKEEEEAVKEEQQEEKKEEEAAQPADLALDEVQKLLDGEADMITIRKHESTNEIINNIMISLQRGHGEISGIESLLDSLEARLDAEENKDSSDTKKFNANLLQKMAERNTEFEEKLLEYNRKQKVFNDRKEMRAEELKLIEVIQDKVAEFLSNHIKNQRDSESASKKNAEERDAAHKKALDENKAKQEAHKNSVQMN